MSKIFFTERDIEDMARRGEHQLLVGDDVVLTDLAYEKAARLGVMLIKPQESPTRSASISEPSHQTQPTSNPGINKFEYDEIKNRVRTKVFSILGSEVDAVLLDHILDRVMSELSGKLF